MNSMVRLSKGLWLALVMGSLSLSPALAEQPDARMAVAKSENAREAFVRENVRLDAEEAEEFWRLYKEYRAKMGPVAKDLINLAMAYADLYPNVNEKQAEDLFEDYMELKEEHSEIESNAKKVPGVPGLFMDRQ